MTTMKYAISIFGETIYCESKSTALEIAQDAEHRYAQGFVQVHEDGCLIYGNPR